MTPAVCQIEMFQNYNACAEDDDSIVAAAARFAHTGSPLPVKEPNYFI